MRRFQWTSFWVAAACKYAILDLQDHLISVTLGMKGSFALSLSSR